MKSEFLKLTHPSGTFFPWQREASSSAVVSSAVDSLELPHHGRKEDEKEIKWTILMKASKATKWKREKNMREMSH